MSKLARKFVWIGIAGVVVVSLAALALYRMLDAGIAASVEHKSAKTTTATVISVTQTQKTNSPNANSDGYLYRLCFIIDNLDQVEPEMRQGYQAREIQRLTKDGPRCEVTGNASIAKRLTKGDKVSVGYLLENQYEIDVVRITALGEDL